MFRSEGLAKALTDAGHSVSARTVDRWKSGESTPSKGHLEGIRELVGATKSAPAGAGAAEELLRLWTGPKAPPWARAMTRQIISAIERDRQAFLDQSAAQYAALAELLHGQDSDDGAPPTTPGPQPKRPGPPRSQGA